MKIAIVNYGMGNLASVRRAFEDIGVDVVIADKPDALHEVDRIVLPGVGAFGEGMSRLKEDGWQDILREVVLVHHKPLLGICLGMQMLATTGFEGGRIQGLDLVPGEVKRLDELSCNLRIPHVGWNEVDYCLEDPLFKSIPNQSDFYFVHSYAYITASDAYLTSTVPYGAKVAASIRNGNVFGCQFHPEKSSKAGRQLLKNFIEYVPC